MTEQKFRRRSYERHLAFCWYPVDTVAVRLDLTADLSVIIEIIGAIPEETQRPRKSDIIL
jgi:hypothetical protein